MSYLQLLKSPVITRDISGDEDPTLLFQYHYTERPRCTGASGRMRHDVHSKAFISVGLGFGVDLLTHSTRTLQEWL